MKLFKSAQFMRHISKMADASGRKRVFYAVGHIILMALGVACIRLIQWSWTFLLTQSLIVGILLLAVGIFLMVGLFLEGFVAQIILMFMAGFGIASPEGRKGNIAAFIIALLTSVGWVVAGIILLMKL